MLPVTIQKWEKCQVMDKESNFMSMQILEMKEVNINKSSVISKLSFVYIFFCLFTYLGGIGKRLKIKAQFLINGQTDDSLTFIDDDVRIPHFDDCEYAREENNIGKIALGCIITVIGKKHFAVL